MKLDDLVKAATARVETVRVVRTAVNPLLWLVGLVTPLSVVAAALIGEPAMRAALFILACVPVIFTLAAYFWYMFRDPDRLQSEEYRIRKTALDILYSKRREPHIVKAVGEIARFRDMPAADGDER